MPTLGLFEPSPWRFGSGTGLAEVRLNLSASLLRLGARFEEARERLRDCSKDGEGQGSRGGRALQRGPSFGALEPQGHVTVRLRAVRGLSCRAFPKALFRRGCARRLLSKECSSQAMLDRMRHAHPSCSWMTATCNGWPWNCLLPWLRAEDQRTMLQAARQGPARAEGLSACSSTRRDVLQAAKLEPHNRQAGKANAFQDVMASLKPVVADLQRGPFITKGDQRGPCMSF